jgi:hypothetical protein
MAKIDADMTLTNMTGQMVLKSHINMLDGYKMDISTVAAGLYVLNVGNAQFIISKRLYKN